MALMQRYSAAGRLIDGRTATHEGLGILFLITAGAEAGAVVVVVAVLFFIFLFDAFFGI